MKNIFFTVFLFVAVTSCGKNPKSTTPKANEAICKMIEEVSICSDKLSDETMEECLKKAENLTDVEKSDFTQEITSEQKQKLISVTKSYIVCLKDIDFINTTPASSLNDIKQCLKNYQSDSSKIFYCE